LLLGRTPVIMSTNLTAGCEPPPISELSRDVAFYFGAVAIVEEHVFWGLICRALEDWRGPRWAIWGSALGSGVHHVGWQGLAGLAGGMIVGLYFAVVRRRVGGIPGLIVVHGASDVAAVTMAPGLGLRSSAASGFRIPAS
jgi:membrane protease YdiL (CAAX protease family)